MRLVSRAPRSAEATLTEAGELILAHADAVIARVQAARVDIELISQPQPLRVGVLESIAMHVLPAALRRLEGLPIAALEADGDGELLEAIEGGEADLAFAELPLPPGPFESTKVLEEPYVLVVPAQAMTREPLRLPRSGRMPALPLVGRRGGRLPDPAEARLGRPRIVRRADTDSGVRALVAAGVGAAVLPRLSLDPADPEIVAIDLGDGLGSRDIVLVSHRFRRLPVAASRFRGVAAGVCAELARGWAGP